MMMEKEVIAKEFSDGEISWEEFFENEISPKIHVGFSITISLSMAMELPIYHPDGKEVAETLFLFNPNSRESIIRNIERINEEDPDQPIIEIAGISLTDYLFRWSSRLAQG